MTYTYFLPDENGTPKEFQTEKNSIVIIGANGSGKSRLGEWIEKQDEIKVHRIGAQRALNLQEHITPRSYEQAMNLLLSGSEETQSTHRVRWGSSYRNGQYIYSLSELQDFEYVLSALLAKQNLQMEEYINRCREKDKISQRHEAVPDMVFDQLEKIWKLVFPQRDIELHDAKILAKFINNNNDEIKYSGRFMSDGERVALYLIAQALCVPEKRTIIIDEPEIHLHRSIIDRLWGEIEREREDCLFIYITHDAEFAASHSQSDLIWVKNYDGTYWQYEKITKDEIPEELLVEILGNRKPILFVEGDRRSLDFLLYSEVYKNYYIVPCGSCTNVILQTKAMKDNERMHYLDCYGLIDRDYRSEDEINSLKNDHIYTLDVAEVENLFIVEEVLILVNKILGYTDDTNVKNFENYIIDDLYQSRLNDQIINAIISEIKYRLSKLPITGKTELDINLILDDIKNRLEVDKIFEEKKKLYNEVLESKNYNWILSNFNSKDIAKYAGKFFSLRSDSFCDFVIRQFHGEYDNKFIEAISKYLPKEIPL